jgi:flavin-dependent dehydrogenase
MGIDEVRTVGSPCRGVLSRWQSDTPGFHDFELLGCTAARAVDRGAVARCLSAHAMRAGASVVVTGPIRGERSRSAWSILADQNGKRTRIACRHLVDATGRTARAIADIPKRLYQDRAVCLSASHAMPQHDPTVLLVDRSTHGWWYAIAAADGTTEVAFVTDADLLPRSRDRATWLTSEYQEATLLASNVDGSPQFASPTGRDARSGHRAAAAGDGWLAVGDAALAWDPLSGQGMQFAIDSAGRAAEAIVTGDEGRRYPAYERWCDDAVVEYGRARTAMYAAPATRQPDAVFWRRRSGHENVSQLQLTASALPSATRRGRVAISASMASARCSSVMW